MPTPIDAILAHPRFAEARHSFIDGYLALYSGDPGLNKLLAEGARHVVITFAICLSAAQRDDDSITWLTLGKLQEVVAAHQVGSPGLVEAIVTRMLDRGLLTSTPAESDRRKRILAPTASLLAHDRDLIIAQARAAAMVLPSPALEQAVACSPEFQLAFRAAAVASFGAAMEMLMRHPAMMLFIARDSGQMALYAMLASARASPDGSMSTVPYSEIADRFGVSRTHIRDMVLEAEAAGLMLASKSSGTMVELLPPLQTATDRFLADAMLLFAECCERAATMPPA